MSCLIYMRVGKFSASLYILVVNCQTENFLSIQKSITYKTVNEVINDSVNDVRNGTSNGMVVDFAGFKAV